MADLGLQGFPRKPEGVNEMDHYRSILERLPAEFSTIWIDTICSSRIAVCWRAGPG